MNKVSIIVLVLLIVGGVLIYKFPSNPHTVKSTSKPSKRCANDNDPCYKIVMANQDDMQLNSWQHYGDSNCVIFNSLPDNDIHGYCGEYKIVRLHY